MNYKPEIHKSVLVADGARIIGKVKIKKDASIWYNAVLRGDIKSTEIVIGKRTSIQDGTVIHTETDRSVIIGDDVTVGHNCVIHACTIEDGCLIGMGAIVLTGAHIKKGAVIGAGAVVKENSVIEENSLAVGIPAKTVKKLSAEHYNNILQHCLDYAKLAKQHINKKFKIYN